MGDQQVIFREEYHDETNEQQDEHVEAENFVPEYYENDVYDPKPSSDPKVTLTQTTNITRTVYFSKPQENEQAPIQRGPNMAPLSILLSHLHLPRSSKRGGSPFTSPQGTM